MVIDGKAQFIFILEDEVLVSMYLEDLLTDLGHNVSQIASQVSKAIEIARDAEIDFAILDINVAGHPSFPVADILRERAIPFVFATGYGPEGITDSYRDEIVLQKPYTESQLQRVVDRLLTSG